ncbi:MAG: cytidylate kinase-like family protein [Lachnospiraceae bacterium]|nr:cytidylate kinase-like family protein [Lachnospiraceae bacterium]
MEKKDQLIIAISREFGSGGHEIAERMAKDFDLPLYDYNLMREIAKDKNLTNSHELEKYDELPRSPINVSIRGFSTSTTQNFAIMQFNYLKEKAENGDSFVIVGRCAETVLKGFDCMIPIFILADEDAKVKRIMRIYDMDKKEAISTIKSQNRKRKAYHNYYSTAKWGDSRLYEISINSSELGIDGTVKFLEDYIKQRRENGKSMGI